MIKKFKDGYAILMDSSSTDAYLSVLSKLGVNFKVPLIIADPPYGDIVNKTWDKKWKQRPEVLVKWMLDWTKMWSQILVPNGAFYVWGGIGKVKYRPFFKYLTEVEFDGDLELSNYITWSKKRGYGTRVNYLFTREELAYFVKGNAKKPLIFNVPYLDKVRGYSGYNKKYPAKDERYRRTNVWMDITEILKGKLHINQKPQKLHEIIIETHTNPGDWVFDPFCGCGTTAFAARKLNRNFIVMDNDPVEFNKMIARLKK